MAADSAHRVDRTSLEAMIYILDLESPRIHD